jgi:amidase
VTTFLLRLDPGPGEGPTVAVKDLIDVAGTPTTSASRPLAESAEPAQTDAPCVGSVRDGGGRIVGKANLHELAFGGSGINPYTGTPVNPLDPTRIPGGSSSGSAVAVAAGEADIALGTDTAGSVRIPSSCCGVVGLKTTFGRISTEGVRPLAPSLDTVGPMATTVAGVIAGMALLERGFVPAAPTTSVGRFRLPGAHPDVETAIDRLLAAAELGVDGCDLPGWEAAADAGTKVLFGEAARIHAALLRSDADQLGDETRGRLETGSSITDEELDRARRHAVPWREELDAALARAPVIATAGIMDEPPPLSDPTRLDTRAPNVAVNLAGNPAIVVPVPRPGHLPTAVQLIGRRGEEEVLVATAAVLEAAAG